MLGQTVTDVIEQDYEAGTNYIDIELNGLTNGFYISRITIGDKYTVVKKLMLIYGSQHLITGGGGINTQLNKSSYTYLETILYSLAASSSIIGRKTFTNLPVFNGDTLDLGNLTIERYCPGIPSVMYEGHIYSTVLIGPQCWLKENLDVGTIIPGIQNASDNGFIEKYCYDEDPDNCITYGGLYQWKEAMQYSTTYGVQGICPPGWHIPTINEFETLKNTVGYDGNALKAIGQGSGLGAGTNRSGFSALLAGERFIYGNFTGIGILTYIWTSVEDNYNTEEAYALELWYDSSSSPVFKQYKLDGLSVRCLKD